MSKKSRSTSPKGIAKPATLSQTALKNNIAEGRGRELLEQKFVVNADIAKHVLETYNPHNRSINETHLSSLIRDIKNGNWIESTGTMISFATNGELIDGQHRLAAIAKTGVALPLSFKFGLDEAARRVIDTNRRRMFSDYIAMTEGLKSKYKTERASVTRLIFGFLHDQERPHSFTNNNKPTQSDLFKVSQEFNDDINEAVSTIFAPGLIHRIVIGSYAAFVYVLAKNSDNSHRVKEFFELLGTGANLAPDNPIMVVRNRLLLREEFRNQKTKDKTIGLLIKAWNHWISGDSVTNKMHSPEFLVPMKGLESLHGHKVYQNLQQSV